MKAVRLLLSVVILLGMVTSCSHAGGNSNRQNFGNEETNEIAENNISNEDIAFLMRQYLLYEYYTEYESLDVDASSERLSTPSWDRQPLVMHRLPDLSTVMERYRGLCGAPGPLRRIFR